MNTPIPQIPKILEFYKLWIQIRRSLIKHYFETTVVYIKRVEVPINA